MYFNANNPIFFSLPFSHCSSWCHWKDASRKSLIRQFNAFHISCAAFFFLKKSMLLNISFSFQLFFCDFLSCNIFLWSTICSHGMKEMLWSWQFLEVFLCIWLRMAHSIASLTSSMLSWLAFVFFFRCIFLQSLLYVTS